MVKPQTHCPAAYVPEVTVCDDAELDPLLAFLETGAAIEHTRTFPRGTVLPDGRLDLCKQSIGPRGTERVIEALRHNAGITSILLGTDAIGAQGVAAIGELVASDETELETIYLGCNRIEGDVVRPLTKALEANRRVRALWLKRNPLGERGAAHVASLVEENRHLEVLDVFNCELGDSGVSEIAARADGLRALVIGGNGASVGAARACADLLRRSHRLEDLNLGASRLGDDGAVELAAGLRENHSLKRLNIASCSIGPRGAQALFEALSDHRTIEVIDASRLLASLALGEPANDLGDETNLHVGVALRDAPALVSLDIRNAGVSSRGALALEPILAARRSIAYLGLSRYVSRRIRRRIAALLERNRAAGARVPAIPDYVGAILSVYRNPPLR